MHLWLAVLTFLAGHLFAEAQEHCFETKFINVTVSGPGNLSSRNAMETAALSQGIRRFWATISSPGGERTSDSLLPQGVDTTVSRIKQPTTDNNFVASDGDIEAFRRSWSNLLEESVVLTSMGGLGGQRNQSTLACLSTVVVTSLQIRTMTLDHYMSTLDVIASENQSSTANGTLSTGSKNWSGVYIPLISSSPTGMSGSVLRTTSFTADLPTHATGTSDSTTHDRILAGQPESMPFVENDPTQSTLVDLIPSLWTGVTQTLRPTTTVTSICKSWHDYNYTQIAVFTLPPSTTSSVTSSRPTNIATITYNLTLTDDRVDATYTFPLPDEATPCPAVALPVGWDLTCGEDHGNQICPGMLCCGRSQLCGSSKDFCQQGCRKDYGLCWHDDDHQGPALIGGFIGGAISGGFGLGCMGICGLDLPTPKDPSCSSFPIGCPPGKGGGGSDGGVEDPHDGADDSDNDHSHNHDGGGDNGENDDSPGNDNNGNNGDCGGLNKHPVSFYRIHCVQYVDYSSDSLYNTCTKTETSTSEVCAADSDATSTEWTTKYCSTTATATATSVDCDKSMFTGTAGSGTIRRSCTTAIKEVSGCEVMPCVTTSFWTYDPTQPVTDYTYYCNNRDGAAGSERPTCSRTVSRVISGCSIAPASTSIFPSCSLETDVSPDDDYGMESKCKKHIKSIVADVDSSCFVNFISSGAYASTLSGCTATKTSIRTGACVTATTRSHYTTLSACPTPNMTTKVLLTGHHCARPQITVSPIEESSCPAPMVGIDSDADQGQCGEDKETCPCDPNIVLSPNDDQGEDGEIEILCPYIPTITLSPDDDQGENGVQDMTHLSMAKNIA